MVKSYVYAKINGNRALELKHNRDTIDYCTIANSIRARLLIISNQRGVPHLGSCFSCVDILTYIYSKKPTEIESTPSVILSKGHAAPIQLLLLEYLGHTEEKVSEMLGVQGSILHEHPPSPSVFKGITAATGSLGHGLPIALGIAYAEKLKCHNQKTYVILGDGECNEGSIWEAASLASVYQLDNLIAVIDFNKWQATDRSNSLAGGPNLKDKWSSFGWDTLEIDGHDYEQIEYALNTQTNKERDKPLAVIANTIKGKGVSFMEDDNNWHYKVPTNDELELALGELDQK